MGAMHATCVCTYLYVWHCLVRLRVVYICVCHVCMKVVADGVTDTRARSYVCMQRICIHYIHVLYMSAMYVCMQVVMDAIKDVTDQVREARTAVQSKTEVRFMY